MGVIDVSELRARLGSQLLERVAGPNGAEIRKKIHETPGERWFATDRPIRRVHGDASMFIGGIRALLLQSLHPLAMAGVAAHSGFRGDPWGRLQRTSYFLAVTTFGTSNDAEEAVQRVRDIHLRVRGTTPDGREYFAGDPHLLKWVHVAELDSFLQAYQRYGEVPLNQYGRDGYVADAALIAEKLGVVDPPTNEGELQQQLEGYRSELEATAAARSTARYLLFRPPLPVVAWGPYGLLASAAVDLLPAYTRNLLRIPTWKPPGSGLLINTGGNVVTSTIRWAMNSIET